MRIKGVASYGADKNYRDTDGEYLNPKGFDLTPLLTSGAFNWEHQSLKYPHLSAVGHPTTAEVKNDNIVVEGILYDSEEGKGIYNLAKTLEKSGGGRRLGFSVEGSVVKRNDNDPKIVDKCIITDIAICRRPKNHRSLLQVLKGEVDVYEKSFTVEDNSDLIKESIETDDKNKDKKVKVIDIEDQSLKNNSEKKVKKIGKSDIIDQIITYFSTQNYSIDIIKGVYDFVLKFNNMSTEKQVELTKEQVDNAMNVLKSLSDIDISKLTKANSDEEEEEDEDELTIDKACDMYSKGEYESENDFLSDAKKAGYSSSMAKAAYKKMNKAKPMKKAENIDHSNDKLIEAIDSMNENIQKGFAAIADLYASQSEEFDEVKKSMNEYSEFIKSTKNTLDKIAETPVGPRSITTIPRERFPNKSNNEDGMQYSLRDKNSRRELSARLLDISGFNKDSKNYDTELAKAAQYVELGGQIPNFKRILPKLQENKIEIIN